MKHRGIIFLVGFILGVVTAFGIAGYYYETGREAPKLEKKPKMIRI